MWSIRRGKRLAVAPFAVGLRAEDFMHHPRFSTEPPVIRLPHPPAPEIAPSAFMMCPIVLGHGQTLEQWLLQQWVYQRAFEQAQAVVRPSLPERDLLAVWN
jgi:hypothetical protein